MVTISMFCPGNLVNRIICETPLYTKRVIRCGKHIMRLHHTTAKFLSWHRNRQGSNFHERGAQRQHARRTPLQALTHIPNLNPEWSTFIHAGSRVRALQIPLIHPFVIIGTAGPRPCIGHQVTQQNSQERKRFPGPFDASIHNNSSHTPNPCTLSHTPTRHPSIHPYLDISPNLVHSRLNSSPFSPIFLHPPSPCDWITSECANLLCPSTLSLSLFWFAHRH